MSSDKTSKVTVPGIRARKSSGRREPDRIVALTAYDYPTARALDEAGVDLLLVGDSLGMVVLGHDSTLPVTIDVMLHHTTAVARAKPRALVVADMPFLSYHTSPADAVRNGGRFLQEAGAEAVKLEGGRRRLPMIRALVEADIPVMGHIGLTPQSVNRLGGYRVQGRDSASVDSLLEDARALEEAGVFSLVLEAMPAEVGRIVTESIGIPTIGIGAGPHCDGQILVIHDLVGFSQNTPPRFVRRYAQIARTMTRAAEEFAGDVRASRFPAPEESYPCPEDLARRLTMRSERMGARQRS
ncbi:MAG: 3-methyl-2-oxobutanoate hydroxymethyltransferase [Acidobacteriota bacterium]